jgi:hypothetical protein
LDVSHQTANNIKIEMMDILEQLLIGYKSIIYPEYAFPNSFRGRGKIRAIVLGADPTHIVEDKPLKLKVVFGLDQINSEYWLGIQNNLSLISELQMDNIYVQNVCKNYFTKETSKNEFWPEIAKKVWLPELKIELDSLFDYKIPVFMTTEIILKISVHDTVKYLTASKIYTECLYVEEKDNFLNRKLFALYRHPRYSLSRWPEYCNFLKRELMKGVNT